MLLKLRKSLSQSLLHALTVQMGMQKQPQVHLEKATEIVFLSIHTYLNENLARSHVHH